jgi:hypothetical protein
VFSRDQPVSANDFFTSQAARFLARAELPAAPRGLLAMGPGYVGGFLAHQRAVETPDVQTQHHAVSADSVGGPSACRSPASPVR